MSESSMDNLDRIVEYYITCEELCSCIYKIEEWIVNGNGKKYLVCANPHSIVNAQRDNEFKKAIVDADMIVPDGIGVVWASRLLGGGIKKRITGMDVFLELSSILNRKALYKYFFVGSTDDVLHRIKKFMSDDFPNIEVVGTFSPPFKEHFTDDDNKKIIDDINNAKPHVLWVGMTAPKQEKWIYDNIDKLNVQFVGAIGAVFDFYAGTKRRSNKWFQDKGLEWLPRVMREPRRLWRRVFISGPLFMYYVFKQKIGMIASQNTAK